jgi:hypothetical protein
MDTGGNADDEILDAHLPWSELAAGHALSSLDEADKVLYLEHAATCAVCRELEADLATVVAELAFSTPAFEPPASLKASIMQAISADDVAAGDAVVGVDSAATPPVSLAQRRERKAAGSGIPRPVWAAAAAVVVLVAVGTGLIVKGASHSTSVADQCAKVKCPTVQLTASGKAVATVMMLNGDAYVVAPGLPTTPGNARYVLWRTANGKAVAVAAFSSTPTQGPIKAGPVTVPADQVGELAISQEPGHVLPAAPTDVLAQGVLSS